jgi:hypothetical protein
MITAPGPLTAATVHDRPGAPSGTDPDRTTGERTTTMTSTDRHTLTDVADRLTTAVDHLVAVAMLAEAELVAVAPDPDALDVSRIVDALGDLAPIAATARIARDLRKLAEVDA